MDMTSMVREADQQRRAWCGKLARDLAPRGAEPLAGNVDGTR
jgi:hypothetical protein